MNRVSVSVPGKLMVMGEHAVLYNHPCIVAAIDKRIVVTAEKIQKQEFRLEAPDVNITNYSKHLSKIGRGIIPAEVQFVETALSFFVRHYKFSSGIKIKISSQIPVNYGFGSSAASTVGTIKALAELFGMKLTEKDLFDKAYQVILKVQKTGSGFDVAASIYGGLQFFINAGKVIESLSCVGLNITVGYTGAKADTVSMINMVKQKLKTHKSGVEKIFENIDNLVQQAKSAILENDWPRLGVLMNYNQDYLEDLGVSTQKINDLITSARQAGAWGAKLSGAGAGDCIIALVSSETKMRVAQAIEKSGGKIVNVSPCTEGVKII